MIRHALCSHYATRNVTPQFPPALRNAPDMELFAGREGIEGLRCGLHSDYVVRFKSFLVTSVLQRLNRAIPDRGSVMKNNHFAVLHNILREDLQSRLYTRFFTQFYANLELQVGNNQRIIENFENASDVMLSSEPYLVSFSKANLHLLVSRPSHRTSGQTASLSIQRSRVQDSKSPEG